jgi:hypothetical protein
MRLLSKLGERYEREVGKEEKNSKNQFRPHFYSMAAFYKKTHLGTGKAQGRLVSDHIG